MRFRAIAQNGASRDSRAGMAEPATTGALNAQQVLLSTLPPSRGQQRLALAIVVVLLAAFCATVPFATVPVGYIGEFIPAYATAMFVISSITSALLFVQFSVVHSRALLAVSGGLGCEPDPVCLRDWSAHDSMAPKPRYRGLKQMR